MVIKLTDVSEKNFFQASFLSQLPQIIFDPITGTMKHNQFIATNIAAIKNGKPLPILIPTMKTVANEVRRDKNV